MSAEQIFAALADGATHSGSALAQRLGVSRNAVWKGVQRLQLLGVELETVPRRGYRLLHAAVPLDAELVRAALDAGTRRALRRLDIAWSLASTNTELLERNALEAGRADVLCAEYQSAGRGRRARRWHAAPGTALCFSVAWKFASLPPALGALSLAIGVALRRALRAEAGCDVQLKWPNDLWLQQRKLGGVLCEMRIEAAGAAQVVVGVGLNVALGPALLRAVAKSGTTAIDLAAAGVSPCDRNQLLARLLREIVRCLQVFGQSGFASFRDEWLAADALGGHEVVVSDERREQRGRALGVDAEGALQLATPAGIVRVLSGDVSLRAAK